jgi:hypothetical protein
MLSERINTRVSMFLQRRTTLEITKDAHLTLQGDCIIAVSADKGLRIYPWIPEG